MKKISCLVIISLFCLSSILPVVNSYYIEKVVDDLDNSLGSGPMDSPWPMHGYDRKHTGLSPFSTQNNTGVEKWRFLCNMISCDPVIDNDGNIYFVSAFDTLYSITSNGKLKWKFELSEISDVTPAIAEDGTIYIAHANYICAVNSDGALKWKYKLRLYSDIASDFTIADDGIIYFGTWGDIVFGEFGGRLYAINPDGTEKWSYEVNRGYSILSAPAVDDEGMIYFSDDWYFYSFYPNGTLKWKFDSPHATFCDATPAIGMNNTVYFCTGWGCPMYALNSKTGELKWEVEKTEPYGSPSIDNDGTIYVTGYESVFAINQNGTIKWQYYPGSESEDQPQTKPAISSDGTIYVGVSAGYPYDNAYLVAINSSDGKEKWRKTLISQDRSGWTRSSPVIGKDGTVYIGTYISDIESFGCLFAFCNGVENIPPSKPIVNGPTSGHLFENYEFTMRSTDPEGEDISYYVVWEPSSLYAIWYGPYKSGETITLNHTWETYPSDFIIRVIARDSYGMESEQTEFTIKITENPNRPSKPKITGSKIIKLGKEYTFQITSTDPNNDDIFYYIDWGDDEGIINWKGPYPSGETLTVSHTWTKEFNNPYIVVRAKDVNGLKSDRVRFSIYIYKTKAVNTLLFLQKLFPRFPFFE